MESILSTFEFILMILMGIQAIFSFLLFLLGDFYLNWYETGVVKPPESWLDKVFNLIMDSTMIIAIYFYKKQQKYPWPIRKLLQLITPFIMSIAFIFIYHYISKFLRMLFL